MNSADYCLLKATRASREYMAIIDQELRHRGLDVIAATGGDGVRDIRARLTQIFTEGFRSGMAFSRRQASERH